jgi:hypothetical protein
VWRLVQWQAMGGEILGTQLIVAESGTPSTRTSRLP